MSNQSITIGAISLQHFEVPTVVQFGGRQRVVVHRTSDGSRITELLGPDEGEIRFQGIFSGESAEERARALDNLRLSGSTVWLTWHSFRYRVIVHEFLATYRSRWWIPYRVSCVVAYQPGVVSSATSTTEAIILGALTRAQSALAGMDVDVSPLASAINANGGLISGTTANSLVIESAGKSLAIVQTKVNTESAVLSSSLGIPDSAPASASSFIGRVGNSGTLANAVVAQSYLGLIRSNLGRTGRIAGQI